ncbi:TPA: hydantoinase B/oxoprolinase family protein [Legionella anisa]
MRLSKLSCCGCSNSARVISIRKGSGGRGLHCGGDGVVRRIRFLEKMIVNIISSHRVIPPYGMQGGGFGKP